jgi:ligand-binding sensor domain-containing protein
MGRLVEDRDGSLWIQGAGGLFHLQGSACEEAGDKQGYPGGIAAAILMDRSGTLWVKTRSGRLLFMASGQAKFQVSPYGEGVSTSFAFLHEAPDGTIWLSDEQGLRRVGGKPGIPAFAPPTGKSFKNTSRFDDFTLPRTALYGQ